MSYFLREKLCYRGMLAHLGREFIGSCDTLFCLSCFCSLLFPFPLHFPEGKKSLRKNLCCTLHRLFFTTNHYCYSCYNYCHPQKKHHQHLQLLLLLTPFSSSSPPRNPNQPLPQPTTARTRNSTAPSRRTLSSTARGAASMSRQASLRAPAR